jgi:hypothetical protein
MNKGIARNTRGGGPPAGVNPRRAESTEARNPTTSIAVAMIPPAMPSFRWMSVRRVATSVLWARNRRIHEEKIAPWT